MNNPLILSQIDKYNLSKEDFTDKFTKNIFISINNLFQNGANHITVIDVDNYLNINKELKLDFEKNGGIKYLQDCIDICSSENFDYYYNRLKKFSALRKLQKDGFDITSFYCDDPKNINYSKIQNQFEIITVKDIFDGVKKKLYTIEEKYSTSSSTNAIFAIDGMEELKESLKTTPDVGAPLQGVFFNTVTRGARKGKFYLRSSTQGSGKTRLSLGDACYLSIPERYDNVKQCWLKRDYSEKVLFITTELTEDEIQTMIIAWVSGVNESIILNGKYLIDEEKRVDKAISIVKKYKNNFILKQIPDPSISAIEACVRQQALTNGIENVFYDYIFSSPSLFNEFKGNNIREDVMLGLLSSALKDLAAELNIFIMSSTQLSGDVDQKKGIRDQRFLRGAKSIADKVDIGVISLWINQEERAIVELKCIEQNLPIPNFVTDVYKVRRGQYKNVKIWSVVDLGTCKIQDIFITDGYYNPIECEIIGYENDYKIINERDDSF